MDARYDEDYFIRGKQSGKSLYENYRWLPELTIPMCKSIANHCSIDSNSRILDFGCARGYSVKAFRQLGFDAWGMDVSEWAINNADPEIRPFVGRNWPDGRIDWIVAKDVLEHIPALELERIIREFYERASQGMFVVVPLAGLREDTYVVPEYEADVTHVIRWPLWAWVETFLRHMPAEWKLTASYRVIGVKDNYAQFKDGNGFITCRKF